MLVLITRPAEQAQLLCKEIAKRGGRSLLLPTIAIADVPIDLQHLQYLTQQDIAIFISPNAVLKAAKFIKQWPPLVKIAAIGAATAQALQELNWPVTIVPHEQFNSEGLLAAPALQQVANKKIILFRGEGGRELLATTLRARGALVLELPVYCRVLPVVERLPDIENVDVIISTSITALQNLTELFVGKHQAVLFSKQLLVSSKRIAEFAQQLGFNKLPLLAANATDEAIIKRLFL